MDLAFQGLSVDKEGSNDPFYIDNEKQDTNHHTNPVKKEISQMVENDR